MLPEHDKYLCENFPLTFATRRGKLNETAMCWGFECGDGWFNIIKEACEKIESILHEMEDNRGYTTCQVKQKYGTLRWYWFRMTKEISDIVCEAEKKSYTICETCGQVGEMRGTDWVYVACDTHATSVSDSDSSVG